MEALRTIQISVINRPMDIVVEAVQGDTGRVIKFILTDNIDLEGAVARFYAKKPSGLEIHNPAEINGREIVIELTAQTLAEAGVTKCQITIVKAEVIITSFEFFLSVKVNLSEAGNIRSSNEFITIEEALRNSRWITSTAIHYQTGTSGTIPPTGQWLETIPLPNQGAFLWTRLTLEHTDGTRTQAFNVSRNARDGERGEIGPRGPVGPIGPPGDGITISNDLTTDTAGSVLDARQGRVLNERISEVNTSLSTSIATVKSDLSDLSNSLSGEIVRQSLPTVSAASGTVHLGATIAIQESGLYAVTFSCDVWAGSPSGVIIIGLLVNGSVFPGMCVLPLAGISATNIFGMRILELAEGTTLQHRTVQTSGTARDLTGRTLDVVRIR